MYSPVLPGEEASAAKIRYDHRQEVLKEREEHNTKRDHTLEEEKGGERGKGGWGRGRSSE